MSLSYFITGALALAGVFASGAAPAAELELTPAQKMAVILSDRGCGIVLDSEKDLWRDADASDFSSSGWKAWITQTGVATPWRATGDYNGDGLQDVAKTVIRKSDDSWMVGVEFGYDATHPCERRQMFSNSHKDDKKSFPIKGVLTLPKGASSVICHHTAEHYATLCSVPANSALERRTTDALIVADDGPVSFGVYLWQPSDVVQKSGKPRMTFESEPMDRRMEMTRADPAASAAAQQGDVLSPAARKQLVAELDAAYDALETIRYRATSQSRHTLAGREPSTETMIFEFTPPQRSRMQMNFGTDAAFTQVNIENTSWLLFAGTWKESEAPWNSSSRFGAQVNDSVITAVKDDKAADRMLRTVELKKLIAEGGVITRTVVIDTNNGRLQKTIDATTSPGITLHTTTTYDYDVEFEPIEAPQG